MSSNYPPQGPGQPNQPRPPYGQPGQPPPYGQPGQNSNQPPLAPTQPQGYGAPPASGNYGPPPGANPYGTPQGVPPYGYPAQQTARSVKPKAKSKVGLIIAGVIVLLVVVGGVLGVLGFLSNVEATDYPESTRASLTDKGTTYVNSLYDNNKSDNDNRKIFLTGDTPAAVFKYYRDDLTSKGWKFEKEGVLNQITANQYSKSNDLLIVLAGSGSQDLVKDAGSKNFIILVTGKNT